MSRAPIDTHANADTFFITKLQDTEMFVDGSHCVVIGLAVSVKKHSSSTADMTNDYRLCIDDMSK